MQHEHFVFEQAIHQHPLVVAPPTPLADVIQRMNQNWGASCELSQSQDLLPDPASVRALDHATLPSPASPVPPQARSGGELDCLVGEPSQGLFLPRPPSCALVMEGGLLRGIFTQQDLVRRIAAGLPLQDVTVEAVMTQPVITQCDDEVPDIFAALRVMQEHGIRHLPILDRQGKLRGIVTPQSIRSILVPTDLLRLRPVGEIVQTSVVCASPAESVVAIAQRMANHRCDAVVIVAAESLAQGVLEQFPVGLMTERDIAQFQLLGLPLEKMSAQSVMSYPLFCVTPQDSLWSAHQQMQQQHISRLVVIGERGELRGIVTQTALMQVLDPLGHYDDMANVLRIKLKHLENQDQRLLNAKTAKLEEAIVAERSQGDRRRKILSNIAQGVAAQIGTGFFRSLVEHLSKALAVDYALIGELSPRGDRVHVRAIYGQGQAQDNFDYALADTPCQTLLGQQRCLYPSQVQAQFPRDEMLREKQIEGYLGNLLCDSTGRALGLLVILSRVPLQDVELMEEVLSIFAARASGELERQQAIVQQERFFSLSLDMLCIAGIDGYFKRINPSFEQSLGFSQAELLREPFLNFVHPDDVAPTLAEIEKLSQGISTVSFENRYRCKDGSYRWFLWAATPYIEEELLYAAARDITERKQAEAQIREQASLLDIATDAIVLYDADYHIRYWNQGAERLYGWSSAEALGQDANQLLHFAPPPELAEIEQALTKTGEWQGELSRQKTKQGNLVTVQSRWAMMRRAADKPLGILVVNTDITEKKQLEMQFLRVQRLESIGTLAGGIAHDLNNILTPILGVAQLLSHQLQAAEPQTQRLLSILDHSAKRGSALVNQVLTFSRGIEGERTVLHLRHLISEIRQIMAETFPKSIELYVDVPADLWPVQGDVTQLHQVLMNLCVNARDAMANGGELTLSARNLTVDESLAQLYIEVEVGPYAVVSVTDTGSGIEPQILAQIFDPFFTTKAPGHGTGLGLATVRSIVKSHRGFVQVASEVGLGSCVEVYLPAAAIASAPSSPTVGLPQGQGELILVVDDEAPIREITQVTLENFNYRVVTAQDGMEAIAVYAEQKDHIAAIVMDMMMPNLDGSLAAQTLAKINPNVRILMSSGLASNQAVAKGLGPVVKGFLLKPFTTETLLQSLDRALGRR